MLISLHLPKTAGTSFRRSLQSHFGDGLLLDYDDHCGAMPQRERNAHALQACLQNEFVDFTRIQCIHGHFMPLKYLPLESGVRRTFITWMRHPVDRIVSNYVFWKHAKNEVVFNPTLKRLRMENWSLEQLCFSPDMQNNMSKFFWGVSLETFAFIGICEHFEADMAYFSEKFLGRRLEVHRENTSRYPEEIRRRLHDPKFREEVAAFHQIDMQFYQRACEIRERSRGARTLPAARTAA